MGTDEREKLRKNSPRKGKVFSVLIPQFGLQWICPHSFYQILESDGTVTQWDSQIRKIFWFFLCVTTDPEAVSRLMALTCTQEVHTDFGTISVPNSCKAELEHSANSGRVWQSPVINVLLLFLFVKVVKIMSYEMIYFCLFGSSPAFQ